MANGIGEFQNWSAADQDAWQQRYKQGKYAEPAAPAPVAPSAPAAPAGPITNAQGVTSTTANVGQTAQAGAPTTVAQSFQQALVNRLNPQPVSAQSPQIAPAIQANKLAEQRGMERDRNLLAERSAKAGTDMSGGFDTALLGLSQDRAGREGMYEGNLVKALADQQSREQTSALGAAGSMLTGQQNLGQQMELANLDAALRREGLSAQTALGQGDLALRSRLGEGNLNLALLSLLQGGDQFNRQLAQQGTQFGLGLDQSGLLGLLGLL